MFEGKELEGDATLEYYNILSNLVLEQDLLISDLWLLGNNVPFERKPALTCLTFS